MFAKRILILIPHPDDEIAGCAAAIARARAEGARVFGAYLSQGCIPREDFWPWQRGAYQKRVARRMLEAEKAADFLGLNIVTKNVQRPARRIWRELKDVKVEVEASIRLCAPEVLWVPAFEGGNPDHDALNALASKSGLPVFEFSEYHLAGGRAHSNTFIAKRGGEITLALSPEEQKMKRAAFRLYESERGNVAGLRLTQEQFRPLPRYDYSKPPHEGKLWYERFQWAPFRPPRVDYTKSAEVAAAIADFLEARGERREAS
ncbi:MAG: PIG-L family deacetylase [Proteobacteria bacterium]|nr:PIG-L family deacetylase [Pseudomonadota bacterium]